MTSRDNPYDWSGDRPRHPVRRAALLDRARKLVLDGESGCLLGCRGMGKSVFLQQLKGELEREPSVDLLLFRGPKASATVARSYQAIADEMVRLMKARGVADKILRELEDHAAGERLRELFETYFEAAPGDVERLVLIYDELDAYAPFGRPFFNELEDIRKSSSSRIVLFTAGGLGVAALDTLLGSSLFSRMTIWILEPFHRDEIARLAEPFEKRGSALSPEVLDALLLASGGNLALATYGLQRMWPMDAPDARDVTEIFAELRANHGLSFLDKIRDPIFRSGLSDAPALVWRELQRSGGRIERARMEELVAKASGDPTVKKPEWVLRMLRSCGLIRCSHDAHLRKNIDVEIIPSILTFDVVEPAGEPDAMSEAVTLREKLVSDVSEVLAGIHRMSPDFFRPEEKDKKQILPEAAFSAALCLGLEPRGWKVEREAQSAAGRTDIKARHIDFEEQLAVIEVKIWLRHDHENIHAQVVSYVTEGVVALATVMITDVQEQSWPETYATTCLEGKVAYTRRAAPGAVAGHFVAGTGNSAAPEVDHFLLRLARRR